MPAWQNGASNMTDANTERERVPDSVLIDMIGKRKLSISFSKYIVHVIDGSTGKRNISYIEYIAKPESGNRPVKVFDSAHDGLMSALRNCYHRVEPVEGESFVITLNEVT